MEQEVKSIEKEAHRLLEEHKYPEAAEMFYRVANAYLKFEKHHPAAMCLASAASCWALRAGEQTFYYAARDYERAAKEAEKTGDLEYTALLYKHAAVCHEKDKDYLEFSECYYRSKECFRKSIGKSIFNPIFCIARLGFNPQKFRDARKGGFREFLGRVMLWLTLSFSSLLWGHGERPHRTVAFGGFFILLSAVLYTQGYLIKDGQPIHPDLGEGIYFSVVTFITVGYGDLYPIGFNKIIAIFEAFGGVFLFPIFITGLCRKYLRE